MYQTLLTKGLKGYGLARSLNFFLQYQALSFAVSALPFGRRLAPPVTFEALRNLAREVDAVIEEDARDIADGIFPASVLKPESPLEHWMRVPRLLVDGVKLNWRRHRQDAHSFSPQAMEHLDGLPEYYRRNFHFQTDGYLSEQSAELYEHQVELLFAGVANAMRRRLLRPLKERIGDGEGVRILEIGAGVGTMARFMRLAFPRAGIVVSDLSQPYLDSARKRMANFEKIEFVQADAANLPFRDQSFDVVCSVYMFHELPLPERRKVVAEAFRVLKPGGLFGYVDSVQLHDRPDFKDILGNFPKDYHEPFFKNYVENPMEDLISISARPQAQAEELARGHRFLSKFGLYRSVVTEL